MLCDITIEFRRERVDCPVLFLKYFIYILSCYWNTKFYTIYIKCNDDILHKTVLLLCELLNMYILRAIQTRYVVTVDGCTKK